MRFNDEKSNGSITGSIRFKVFSLILIFSLAFFTGSGILVFNGSRMQETALLGGGFFEPYAFYPDAYGFHCFANKVISEKSIPAENNAIWAWDVDTYEEQYIKALLSGITRFKLN
jgi:hypothetical protein